jgi:hypothetical protein
VLWRALANATWKPRAPWTRAQWKLQARYSRFAPKYTLAAVERLDAPTEQSTDTTIDTKGLERVSAEASILHK